MPLARIVAGQQADAAPLCEQLHMLGYLVEVVDPSEPQSEAADVEITLDQMPLSQALEYVAQRSTELQCDVWVAPGVLSNQEFPDLEPMPELNQQEEPFSAAWELDPLLAARDWEAEDQEEQADKFGEAEESWTESGFLAGLQLPELPSPDLNTPELTPDEPPPDARADRRAWRPTAAQALAQIGDLLTAWAAVCGHLAFAGQRRAKAAWEDAHVVGRQWLAEIASRQRHWRTALRRMWRETWLEKKLALQQRRQDARLQRQAEDAAIQAAMEQRAQENVLTWSKLALRKSTPPKAAALSARTAPVEAPSDAFSARTLSHAAAFWSWTTTTPGRAELGYTAPPWIS